MFISSKIFSRLVLLPLVVVTLVHFATLPRFIYRAVPGSRRAFIDAPSLIADSHYIHQNAPRLMRALFEISLAHSAIEAQGAFLAERLLEWCKMLERRLWDRQSVLRHFCYANVFGDRRQGISSEPVDRGRRDRDSVS